jgi:hypothetical protein
MGRIPAAFLALMLASIASEAQADNWTFTRDDKVYVSQLWAGCHDRRKSNQVTDYLRNNERAKAARFMTSMSQFAGACKMFVPRELALVGMSAVGGIACIYDPQFQQPRDCYWIPIDILQHTDESP